MTFRNQAIAKKTLLTPPPSPDHEPDRRRRRHADGEWEVSKILNVIGRGRSVRYEVLWETGHITIEKPEALDPKQYNQHLLEYWNKRKK